MALHTGIPSVGWWLLKRLLIVKLILVFSLPAVWGDPSPRLRAFQNRLLDSVARFSRLTSFCSVKKIRTISLSDADIPFLKGHVDGRMGTCIELNAGKLAWTLPMNGENDPYTRSFCVYLDAHATQTVAITSRAVGEKLLPKVSTRSIFFSPGGSARIYDSTPSGPPKVSFAEALEAARADGSCYPPLAQEIDAYYLNYSWMNEPPHPVWVLNMRRLPTMEVSGPVHSDDEREEVVVTTEGGIVPKWRRNPDIPTAAITDIVAIVDAISGKVIYDADYTVSRVGYEKPESESVAETISVKGEVRTPQWIALTSGLTALDSIQIAGGFLWPFPRLISIQRGSVKLTVDVVKARKDRKEDLVLQPGDIVSVP
jgi:hypothetical protein